MAITERGVQAITCSVITNVIASIAVGLRLWTRKHLLNFIGKEDWCILAALFFSWGNTIGNFLQVGDALGHHWDDLSKEQKVRFSQLLFGTFIVYRLALTMTKVAILFLYLRIFNVPRIKTACYIQLGIVIAYGIHLVLTTIFKCVPVQKFWYTDIPGTCIPSLEIQFINAAINIVTDFMILILPLPVIGSLRLSRKQKISLYSVFTLGFFVCIVSIVRLHGLDVALKSTDPTWDNTIVVIWSAIELNTGITCACLTTLRPLITRIFPGFMSSNQTETEYTFPYQNGTRLRSDHLDPRMGATHNRTAPLDSRSDTSILRSDNFDLENYAGDGGSNDSKDLVLPVQSNVVEIGAGHSQSSTGTVDGQEKGQGNGESKKWHDDSAALTSIRVDTVVEQRFETDSHHQSRR